MMQQPLVTHKKDVLLWVTSAVLLVIGFAVNYYFTEIPLPLRMAGWLLVVLVLLGLIALTAQGKRGWKFYKDAQGEMRKVVWPTRQETTQTTLVVSVMVVVLALFLWGVDSIFMWAITRLTS